MVLTMGLVLWGASGILWLALSCLLALMVVRELFQMVRIIFDNFFALCLIESNY
jgi:hypothetical protein